MQSFSFNETQTVSEFLKKMKRRRIPKKALIRPIARVACQSAALEEEYDPCNPSFPSNTYKIPMLNISEISRLLLEIAPYLPHSDPYKIPDQFPPPHTYTYHAYRPDIHKVSLPRDPRNRRHSFLNHVL